jgi:hypothetical protein
VGQSITYKLWLSKTIIKTRKSYLFTALELVFRISVTYSQTDALRYNEIGNILTNRHSTIQWNTGIYTKSMRRMNKIFHKQKQQIHSSIAYPGKSITPPLPLPPYPLNRLIPKSYLIITCGYQRPVQQSEHSRLFTCARFWTVVFAIVKKRAHANNRERSLLKNRPLMLSDDAPSPPRKTPKNHCK